MQRTRDIRREYSYTQLRRSDLAEQPLQQFQIWFEQALANSVPDATSMALATADTAGQPSVRIVLLKEFDQSGFVWFSDSRSEKGQALAANPQAELLFFWREMERQVRIRGAVSLVPAQQAEEYFQSRPLASQLAAATSEQSQPVESRHLLEARYAELEQRNSESVTRPEAWNGFRLIPQAYEFWQGREGRLHDRFRYSRPVNSDATWIVERLQP
jgi:pyridoxamine 5'-phosphate oxidase